MEIKKLDEKGEPWLKVVKRAEHVREQCKEWGSKQSFSLKQVAFKFGSRVNNEHRFIQICFEQGDTIIDPDGQKHRAYGNEVWR